MTAFLGFLHVLAFVLLGVLGRFALAAVVLAAIVAPVVVVAAGFRGIQRLRHSSSELSPETRGAESWTSMSNSLHCAT